MKMNKNQVKKIPSLFAMFIIADWDETITVKDTISTLAGAAYAAKPDYRPEFSHFSAFYGNMYRKYSEEFEKLYGHRNTIEKEYNFQKGLSTPEKQSLEEITRQQLFAGIHRRAIEAEAKKVVLRPGAVSFFNKCQAAKIAVAILSINWSKTFIEASLAHHGISGVEVYVNELEFENDVTTGRFERSDYLTGVDKLRVISQLMQKNKNTMYIGDSTTDLLALMEVPYGVAMEGGRVLQTCHDLGIEVKELSNNLVPSNGFLYSGNWNLLNNVIHGTTSGV